MLTTRRLRASFVLVSFGILGLAGCTIVNNPSDDAAVDGAPNDSSSGDSTLGDSGVGSDTYRPESSTTDTYGTDSTTTDSSTADTYVADTPPFDASGHPPGSLDLSFGASGLVTYDPTTSEDESHAIVQQPDGKILLFGYVTSSSGGTDFAVARFDASGVIDPSFGTAGLSTLDVGYSDFGEGMALQADGSIVAVGYGTKPTLMRFTSSGAVDTAFGTSGVVNVSFGTTDDRLRRVLVTPSGKIVATGLSVPASSTFQTTLAAFNADGSVDSTFGTSGQSAIFPGTKRNFSNAIAQLSDGSFVLGGYQGSDVMVTHVLADGSVDSAFGTGGVGTKTLAGSASIWAIAVQPDGKLVVAGASGSTYSMTIVRFDATGNVDDAFGDHGVALISKAGMDVQAYGVAIEGDGKIVAGGFSGLADTAHFIVARFDADGTADTTFGTAGDGTVTTAFPAPNFGDFSVELLIQSDGPILLGGYRYLDNPSVGTANVAWAMARYWW